MIRRSIQCALIMFAIVLGSCDDATSGSSVVSLRFVQQPAGGVAGEPLTFSIELVDATGARVLTHDNVTFALGSPVGVRERTVRAENGLATISDYVITFASDMHIVSATSRGLLVASLPFAVTAGEADGPHSTAVTLVNQSLLTNTPRTVVFTFADQYGNPIPRAEVSVTSSLVGATLVPTGGKTLDDGTFQTTYRPPAAGTANFSAVVNGKAITISEPLPVVHACAPSAPTVVPGTVTGVLIRDQGCLIAGLPFQFHQFTMPTAGGLSLDIRPTFFTSLELRADPALANVPLIAADTINRQWLLPAGTYEFRIGAANGQGSYTVEAKRTPANRGDTIRILALPGTYTGQTLDLGDFLNSVDSFTDAFVVYSSRPCTITVRSTAFDAYLSLVNAFGITVGADDNSGGGTDAQITRSSCISSGNAIRIDVASAFEFQTGPYTLIVTFN